MKKQLKMRNLMQTHYENENGNYVLEFDVDGSKILVTVRGIGSVDDEFYWDDEDNLARAVEEATDDDIEIA